MPLEECMKSHTETQLKAWLVWIAKKREQDLAEPTPTQWYLMQIAAEVARVLSKNPRAIKTESFKIKFTKPKKLSLEQVKARWFGLVGYKGPK